MEHETIDREIRNSSPPLTESQLKYLLTGTVPGEYSESGINAEIEKKIESIPERLATFVEDLVVLQKSDEFEDRDWSSLWDLMSDPASRNAVYAEENSFNPTNSDIDEQSYQIGLQIGHLANLFLNFAYNSYSADKKEKNRKVALAAFTLGSNKYGLTSVGSNFVADFDSDILEDGENPDSIRVDLNMIEGGVHSIGGFEDSIEHCISDGTPTLLSIIRQKLTDSNLKPLPPIVNMVFNKHSELPEVANPDEMYDVAIEYIQVHYRDEIERVEEITDYIWKDLEKLSEGSSRGIGPDISEIEVLRAAALSSRPNSDDIYAIVRRKRKSNEPKLKTDRPIYSVLSDLKGESEMPSYWDDYPLIDRDNTLTEYGKLLAQIIFQDKNIRETNRYLPIREGDKDVIYPLSPELSNACYGFALDGPSIESIDGSWNTLFNDAYHERVR